ncbi:MAG: hypothetical protein ABJG41_16240 [Cyclobacteriaceae bacterium]
MSDTSKDIEQILTEALKPIITKLDKLDGKLETLDSSVNIIRSDLAEIRHDLGYGNLRILRKADEKDEM